MTIKAKYIGKTSMGFQTNEIYNITTKIIENHIYVYDTNGFGWCPYDSLESLLRNWKFI